MFVNGFLKQAKEKKESDAHKRLRYGRNGAILMVPATYALSRATDRPHFGKASKLFKGLAGINLASAVGNHYFMNKLER